MREFASFILRSDSDIRAGDEAYIVKVTKKRGIPAFLFGFTAEKNRAIFFNCQCIEITINGVLYE